MSRFGNWLSRMLNGKAFMEVNLGELNEILTETHVRELAYWSCVGMIARLVGKCEFQTLARGSPVKGDEWYAWNVAPNKNQNSTQFIAQIIHNLYGDKHEALVVDVNGQLLVADSYTVEERALAESIYTGVTINGYTLRDTFPASEVLLFRQSPENMRILTNLMYETYGKLIAYNAQTYQASRARKGVLKSDAPQSTNIEDLQKEAEIVRRKFKAFFGPNDAVLPLYEGQSYTDLSGSKTYTNENTRDMRAMIDDVLVLDARSLGIAPALMTGDVAGIKDAVQMTLTACIDPLTGMMAEEINRKRYGKIRVLAGDGVHVDTSTILHTDLFANAPNLEKLISSGLFSVNDLLRKLGQPAIPEAWADEHFVTKNFEEVKKANGTQTQV